MRSPIFAPPRLTLFSLLAAAALLAGCAGEATAPPAAQRGALSQLRTSPFVPTAAQRALVGASDGTYTFTIDPTQDQSLSFGASHLDLPANSICDLAASSYGSAHWNEGCAPETGPVTITAIVKNAATDHPSVDFYPAMRFNPDTPVSLYLHVTNQETLDATKVMKYCNERGCIDESIEDASLVSNVDVVNNVVFRRIKHFSGYVVAERVEDALEPVLN